MRWFKCRAWDHYGKVMIGSDYPDGYAHDIYDCEEDEIYGNIYKLKLELIEEIVDSRRFTVMAYTGVCDLAGHPIYMGDIVEYDGKSGVVCWDNSKMAISFGGFDVDFVASGDAYYCSDLLVRGHIFEEIIF